MQYTICRVCKRPVRQVGETKSQIVFRCNQGHEVRRAKPGSKPNGSPIIGKLGKQGGKW